MLSVDGTDFRLAMGYSKPFYSFKFKKSGVRYEVGLCIKTGDICWWNGPYEPGIWNDEMIFKDALKSMLEYMARGARLMEGIGVVHLSSLNVPKEFGEIVESGRCRRK